MKPVELTNLLLSALSLPDSCRVDQRVPKKMLVDNGAPAAGDKRLLNDALEEIQWIAALKPNTVGVSEFRNQEREYLEIAVLSVATRGASAAVDGLAPPAIAKPVNTTRLAELLHRAVPYPLLLLLATPNGVFLSVAHKRASQNEVGKVVLDGEVTTVDIPANQPPVQPFLEAFALSRQPQSTLMGLYQGWLDCLTALQASRYTGTFRVVENPAQAVARRTALRECQRLEIEAGRLRAQARREKQMAKQVDLNLALMRVLADLTAARKQI